MKPRQYGRKPAPDTSVVPASNLLQTRPFHAEHTPQPQESAESSTAGFDLTKTQSIPTPHPTSALGQPLQAKLTIGQPNDKYEQEADRVAHDVVQQIHSSQIAEISPQTLAQRQEDTVQMKPLLQRGEALAGGEASSNLESSINQARGSGQPLDANLQRQMGQVMGADFSGVRVHTDSRADKLNHSIQAKAFTTGQDIFFRQGNYNPTNLDGQKLLAHELTHVLQQKSSPVIQREEGKLNPGDNIPEMDETVAKHFQDTKKAEIEGKISVSRDIYIRSRIQDDINSGKYEPLFNKNASMKKELSNYEGTLYLQAIRLYSRAFLDGISTRFNQLANNPNISNFGAIYFPVILGDNYFTTMSDENVTLNKNVLNSTFLTYWANLVDDSKAAFPEDQEAIELATKFLDTRSTVEMPNEPLTEAQKEGFSRALRAMPTVQLILSAHETPGNAPEQGINASQWKDGGYLAGMIESSTKDDKNKDFKHLQRDLYDSGDFQKRVIRADKFVRALTEPEILGKLNRPKIVAHLQNEDSKWGGFRAFCRTREGEVHVSQDQDVSVIVHEIMHYIEHNLPDDSWHDIHLMMRARHANATAKSGKDSTKVGRGGSGMRNEGRYEGEYKATGKYTSSLYSDGDTEVTSMTTQFLSDPKQVNKMLDKDPQQTAIILRALRPKEYAKVTDLRFFDHYLPHAR